MRPKTGLPSELGPKGPPLLSSEPEVVPLQRDWMSRAVLLMAVALLVIAAFGVWMKFRPVPYQTERWLISGGFDRGRMLNSLMAQTTFDKFPRVDVEHYLGRPDFDERQFWYDLGPADPQSNPEPRAWVGDSTRLYAVFSFGKDHQISQVLYSRRRPTLGSDQFDSTGWFAEDRSRRRAMFTRALGELRSLSLDRWTAELLLGPADGVRVRAHYDVGLGGKLIGSHKALIFDYDEMDIVRSVVIAD